MGFRRLILAGLIAASVSFGLPYKAEAQPAPTTVPTTNLVGDYTVGPTYNGVGGNFWEYGTIGQQAATSSNWVIKAVAPTLGQNTTLTIPDPGSAAANYLLDQGATSALTIQHVTVPLSSANLLAMYATPVNLIPAPAAGVNIIVHKVMFTMNRTATAFTGGGVLEFQIGSTADGAGTATTATIAASVLTTAGAATTYTTVIPVSYTGTAATGLYISNQTATFAAGTGTAVVDIWYSEK